MGDQPKPRLYPFDQPLREQPGSRVDILERRVASLERRVEELARRTHQEDLEALQKSELDAGAARSAAAIDTTNRFMVSAQGDKIVLLLPPHLGQSINRFDALCLAAWLVAIADPSPDDGITFAEVLAAVKAT